MKFSEAFEGENSSLRRTYNKAVEIECPECGDTVTNQHEIKDNPDYPMCDRCIMRLNK